MTIAMAITPRGLFQKGDLVARGGRLGLTTTGSRTAVQALPASREPASGVRAAGWKPPLCDRSRPAGAPRCTVRVVPELVTRGSNAYGT